MKAKNIFCYIEAPRKEEPESPHYCYRERGHSGFHQCTCGHKFRHRKGEKRPKTEHKILSVLTSPWPEAN